MTKNQGLMTKNQIPSSDLSDSKNNLLKCWRHNNSRSFCTLFEANRFGKHAFTQVKHTYSEKLEIQIWELSELLIL